MDYSILWKYFNASLNTKEEKELKRWLAESSKHRQYFERLKKNQANNSIGKTFNGDSFNAWRKLKLAPKRKNRAIWKIGIAASILLCVAVYYNYEVFIPEPEQIVGIENIQFEPGIKKATLILNSGEQLKLETVKDTIIQEAEVITNNGDSRLNYQRTKKSKEENTEKEIKYNTLIVPRGGEYSLTLSDGTEVKVNSESILKYPVVFENDQRNIQLIGEAFFDVRTDSLRPFVVSSGNHLVKVYGTSFNLKSYENDEYIATTLVEGKLAVATKNANGKEQELIPGYQSIYQKEANAFEQQRVNIKEFTAWKDGRFYFRKMRLDDITAVLGRWYDVEFQFKNENKKMLTFNGNLKKYENIQTILNQLVKTNEITFSAYDKIIYVD